MNATSRRRQPWTPGQLEELRRLMPTCNARAIADRLGRSVASVHSKLRQSGLKRCERIFHGERFARFIHAAHKRGMSSAETAERYSRRLSHKVNRHTVADWWRRMGLKPPLYSAHQRAKVAAKTREQLNAAGLSSLGELRLKAWREAIAHAGWPADLRPRHVQILNALYMLGPMTRRELADACGMPWKGSRRSLVSNDPEGTYLAHLVRRGLVVDLGRIRRVTGQGKGRSQHVYSLPLHVQPNPESEEIHVVA